MTTSIFESRAHNARDTERARRGPSTTATRVVLFTGCIAAVALALQADPSPLSRSDPELALLLRGMAAIKALMTAAAIALLAWRLGRPVTRRVAAAYVVGAWLVTGATTMIWQLSSIVPAALAFHLGLMLLLVAAWRDEASPWRRVAGARRRIARAVPDAGRPRGDIGLATR